MRKVCSKCRQEKNIEEFYGPKRPQCKSCERESARNRMRTPENRMKNALRNSQKTAEKYGVYDDLTLDDIRYVFAMSGGKCSYCGEHDPDKLQIDHAIPLSRYGWNSLFNIVPSCGDCNRRKQAEALLGYIETNKFDVELLNALISKMAYRMGVERYEVIDILNGQQAEYSREDTEKYIKRRFTDADIEGIHRKRDVECNG